MLAIINLKKEGIMDDTFKKDNLNLIFKENINRLLKQHDKTQLELAKFIGVSNTTINNYVKGYNMPRMDKVDKICSFFNVKRSDLIEDNSSISDKKGVRINVVGSVPAGVPVEAITDIIDWEEIPQEWTRGGKEYIGLKVKGDSMYPKYIENDTIIVLITPDCDSGQDCVVFVNGYDATLKKVRKNENGTITLIPFNREYPEKTYGKGAINEEITIFGKVVEIRRKP